MKDWRTLAAEDGPVGRYLLRLDREHRERRNRDLVRLLLSGGRTMTMREEVKEAMAKAAEAQGYGSAAGDIRRETLDSSAPVQTTAAAVLTIIDQYEEVEVVLCEGNSERWLRLPGKDGRLYNPLNLDAAVILMRKPEPKPDVPELARRAVKAWSAAEKKTGNVCAAMDALTAGVDALDE